MESLRLHWRKLTKKYTDDNDLTEELWREIAEAYSSPKRHYHNLHHLEYMIHHAINFQNLLSDPDTLLFSVFYHDIIYIPEKKDNEEKSAELAVLRLLQLKVPSNKANKCRHQILATASHLPGQDNDTNFLIDFDLAILGEEAEVYRNYTEQIRKEFSIYPDILYRPGRKKVLKHFLAMDRIFKTEEFYKLYESQARKNIARELETL